MLVAERTRARARVRLDREAAPAGMLVAGALAVALVAVITGLQVTIAALDETVYKFAAVQHANDFPLGALTENTSRGVARLYSFVVAPLFWLFDGDVAVRLARALNGVLFAATAIPVALLARRVTGSGWSAAAAGVLSVAVPWLTLATIMFSESLAYLLFACAALAMLRTLEAPSWRRDLLVIALLVALVFARVQFVVLLPAWVVFLAVTERHRWRSFPVTSGLTIAAVVGAVGLLAVGLLSGRLRDLAGPYYDIANRDNVPGNFGLGLLWEVEMLALGIGLLPAVLAAAWFVRALGRRDGGESFRFAALGLTLVAVLFAGTLWAQGGWLDWRSEERYFIYAVPFLWIGAVAAIERADIPVRQLVVGGIALAFVLFTVPIAVQATGEQAFLGPVSMSAGHALPRIEGDVGNALGLTGALSARDLLGVLCLLLVGLAAFAWRRGPRARRLALIPAIALQLFVAFYAFSGVYGKLDGIGGLTPDTPFADLGWVDRATPGDPRLFLVDNQSEGREGYQRNTVFWNDEVTDIYTAGPMKLASPGFPVFTLPTTTTDVVPDLRLSVPLSELAVTAVNSPLWQVEGELLERSPDGGMALVRPAKPWRASWMAQGIDTDGQVVKGVDLRVLGGRRVRMQVRAPVEDGQLGKLSFDLAGQRRTVEFGDGKPSERILEFDACGREGVVSGRIDLENAAHVGNNRFSGGRLMWVALHSC
ncbi:MAG: glycosyltransferase family 39 protein [Actinomycetota bacterium]|nr:glycosyltransferase family 39 protein [Actinomycetota bacterium]MDQ5807055.1 glycosyltransferase family 39 protein [Actinomycetota bacterium]